MRKTPTDSTYVSYAGDALITQLIKSKFATKKDVAVASIHIKTVDGVVWLSGYVSTEKEKWAIEDIARQVRGVKSVRNEITLRP